MIHAVTFASCYVYSPCGGCAVSARSRVLCSLLKAGDVRLMLKYAGRVRQQAADTPALAGFFGESDVLVPVPGWTPRIPGAGSVTHHLAASFVREGLGRAVWPGLRRTRPVRKSATAAPGERPTLKAHYDTLAVECADFPPRPSEIVLVDDVVTKGRTLLAAAMRLQEALPHSRIRAFALLRTMGFIPEVHRLLDPCIGEIRLRAGDAHRHP
jgi:predicted amidophosphoribosyltransferase